MYIISIDPGISGAICFFENGTVVDVIDMPSMADGKKNKKQVNGSQIYNEINLKIKNIDLFWTCLAHFLITCQNPKYF